MPPATDSADVRLRRWTAFVAAALPGGAAGLDAPDDGATLGRTTEPTASGIRMPISSLWALKEKWK